MTMDEERLIKDELQVRYAPLSRCRTAFSQKGTRYAAFTLGVFYDRHAGCVASTPDSTGRPRTVRRRRSIYSCSLHVDRKIRLW